jgi:hypothetical protein
MKFMFRATPRHVELSSGCKKCKLQMETSALAFELGIWH